MLRTTRTRSRAYIDSPIKNGTPLKHKHAVTPVRRPPKRRRLGVSALATNRLGQSSDSDDSDFETYRSRGRLLPPGSPLMFNRGRKPAGRARSKLAEDDTATQSPRKRKRHGPGSGSSAGSDSWVETEDDETAELIGEDDQHLLQDAPAASLHRLRKSELIRLWKVAGMWLSEEDEMDEEGEDGRELGKSELVDGLIKARKQFVDVSPGLSSPSLERAFSPMVLRSRSNSTLTSPPYSSSEDEDGQRPREMDVDSTPKAVLRTRSRVRPLGDNQRPSLRRKGAPKQGELLPKPKGKVNRRSRVRIASTLPVEHTPRFKRRSSTLSSAYTTTTDGSAGEEQTIRPGLRKTGQSKASRSRTAAIQIDTLGGVRATPVIQRLRPRRGASFRSNASTEVDADAEDNGDDEGPVSSSSSMFRQRSGSDVSPKRDKHDRHAKSEALKALTTAGDNASQSGPSRHSPMSDLEDNAPANRSPVRTSTRRKSSSSKRASEKAVKLSEPAQEDIEVDSQSASFDDFGTRTTRSGKAFGDLEPRDPVDFDDDDEDMDTEDGQMSSHWVADFDFTTASVSSLTRLRREQLVQLCEAKHLAVGGTKSQLARVLLDWHTEQQDQMERTSNSSQSTARPESPQLIHAVASNNSRADGVATPVLLRDHIHATDPATPPRSDDDLARSTENDLNLDLQELGLEDFTIKPEHLVKLEKIGSGGFKDVYVGKLRGRKVAISEFRSHLSEMDIRELKLLAEFRHPNIVRFRGICIPEDSSQVPCMLISELCENGDLFDYIRNVSSPPLKRVLQIMLDIARGLEYLHLRQPAIIHRDCKSTNILITRQGVAKVGDFGLARVKHSTRSMIRSLVGTVNWQAPELWHPAPRYDYKVDVFSAALVFWEMLAGWFGEQKYPWEGHNEHYIYDAVGQKQKRPPLSGLRKHWGAEPVNLIERMWHQDPAERPTMSDVVADLEALIAEC